MSNNDHEKFYFFECSSCKTLHLSSKQDIRLYQCSQCNGKAFDLVEKKFLIHCPKCYEYWPKRVVRLVVQEGICECLNHYQCDGLLLVRKRWTGAPAQLVLEKNAFEKAEILHLEPFPPQPVPIGGESEVILKNEEIIEPRDPFHDIFSNIDFSLDLASLSSSLTDPMIDQYLLSLKLCYFDEIPLNSSDYISVFSSTLVKLESHSIPIVHEPVNYVYYVGDICGDFQQLQNLCNYFIPIIENFPAVKIIFLGNYFNLDHTGIEMFSLLCLFYLKYPDNVVLLRGANDFHEKVAPLSLKITSESITPAKLQNIYRLIMHILARVPYFHIASMNQGQIKILAQNTGIPLHATPSEGSFILTDIAPNLQTRKIKYEELDEILQRTYTSKPDSVAFQDNSRAISQQAFAAFLQANKCHYMVRSNEILHEGLRFDFANDLCCTLFSAKTPKSPSESEDTVYMPKIIRLIPGQSPSVIDTTDGLPADLEETFGISPDDY